MADCYANENFPLPVVEALRELGHNLLTTYDSAKGRFMILSDKQMHVSKTALAKLEAALDTIRSQSDSAEWVRQIEIDALESQIEDLQADMTRYENLRAGQIKNMF